MTTMALSCPFLIPAGGQIDYQLAGVGPVWALYTSAIHNED